MRINTMENLDCQQTADLRNYKEGAVMLFIVDNS